MEFFKALWTSFNEQVGDAVYLGDGTVITLNIIVWSLFIGFMSAIAATLYTKLVPGALVRALIEKKAADPNTALTAKEAGRTNAFVKFSLRRSSTLRRIVYMVGDTPEERARTPFDEAKFYVPVENIHRAESIFGKSDLSVFKVVLAVAAFFVLAILAFTVVPDLVTLLANFIGAVKGGK